MVKPTTCQVMRVCVLDFDGPVADIIQPWKRTRTQGAAMFHFEDPTTGFDDDIPVSNFELLQVWFSVLHRAGVLVVPGSQRCAGRDAPEQSLAHQHYLAMYALFDELFGPRRPFFLKQDGDLLAEGLTPRDLNDSKNAILKRVHLLPGCAGIQPQDIIFVDDHADVYRAPAESEGFRFIHCIRDATNLGIDSGYLVEALYQATSGLHSPHAVLKLIEEQSALPGAEHLAGMFAERMCISQHSRWQWLFFLKYRVLKFLAAAHWRSPLHAMVRQFRGIVHQSCNFC
eukprot:gnl/MRDRNA2_/MRDRNA2_30508_c0_seq1.p1 gnl/MRDRNA2_/MRDRNA2_30508_c0~~gnl/MRDRNA2_/MRDRNA2_30508_c0_seq1.p1  ORF type:complete len:285 (-),score=27.99 gnl/MRDRNA2_/MRDRNA2_30508_c0_seq1:103-957(-)